MKYKFISTITSRFYFAHLDKAG